MPYVQYIWAFVFAVFFYKVGDMEFRRGYLALISGDAIPISRNNRNLGQL